MTRSPGPGPTTGVMTACPFCDAKYRSPWKKLYTAMTCQKCGQQFILTQPGEPPLSPTDPLAQPSHASADTDPAPVLVAATDVAPVPVQPGSRGDAPLALALLAAVCFGLAALATLAPYGRFASVVLASLGVLFASLSLLGLEKRVWLGWTTAGLNGLYLGLVLVAPAWFGLVGWTPQDDPELAPKPVTSVGRDGSLPRPADWVDASSAVWDQGDIRVAVTTVTIGPVNPRATDPARRKELCLRMGIKVSNVGVARIIECAGWDTLPKLPSLTADGVPLTLRPGGVEMSAKIFPGKSAEGTLMFSPPTQAQELRLEIPTDAVGSADPVRFHIPQSMIGRR